MVERFLRYSLERGQKILLIVTEGAALRRLNVTVTAIDDDKVSYITARSAKIKQLARADILSACYARGDDGDTLKNEQASAQIGAADKK